MSEQEQSEALRLAELLENSLKATFNTDEAAAELRRLHEVNQELLGALKKAKWMLERDYIDDQKMCVIEKCEAAIAKAQGERNEVPQKARDY